MVRSAGRLAAAALSISCLVSASAHAATFRVALASGLEYVGVIQAFDEGRYALLTHGGLRTFHVRAVTALEVLSEGEALRGTPPAPLFSVTAKDSRVAVGSIVGLQDGALEVQTRSGVQRFAVDQVTRVALNWIEATAPVAEPPARAALPAGTLRLAGSSVMAALHLPTLLEAYSAGGGGRNAAWSRDTRSPIRTFTAVAGSGTFSAELRRADPTAAVELLAAGDADLVMLSRRLFPEEARRLVERGLGDPFSAAQEIEIAPGAVAVIVHPSNPVKSLTQSQLVDIFSGRIRNWRELGGGSRRIQLLVPKEDLGLKQVFQRNVLAAADFMPTARILEPLDLIDTIANDQAAIGIGELYLTENVASMALTGSCGQPVPLTPFTLQTREYPLTNPHYLYITNKASPAVRAFIEFAVSPAGQKALGERGLLSLMPLTEEVARIDVASPPAAGWPAPTPDLARQITIFMRGHKRVGTALGFEPASDDLSAEGERGLARIVAELKSRRAGDSVTLFGFSDRAGNFRQNVELSLRRARAVEERLRRDGMKVDGVFGFGPFLPVDCEETAQGARRNHRVEVWVK